MKIPALMACAALIVPVTVMGQSSMTKNTMGSEPAPQISVEAQHFLSVLASEDQSEINMARLALKKSSNAQIQQYAKSKILAADPSMEQTAKGIAQRGHFPVTGLPDQTAEAEYYYLSRLSGKAFDKAYMSYEDQKQAADLIMVQNEVTSAKEPQVKSFAQKEVAPVQQAAQAASKIAHAVGA